MFKKILLIFLGLMLSLILLELCLQTTSFIIKNIKNYKTNQELEKKNSITILCVGESTTDGQWPRYLEEALKVRGVTKKIKVIDEGHGGQNTDYLLKEVVYKKFDIYKPDMIVIMQGINDHIEQIKNIKISKLKTLALFYMIKENISLFCKFKYLDKEYSNKKKEFIADEIRAYRLSNRIQEAEKTVLNMLESHPCFNINESLDIALLSNNANIVKKIFPIENIALFRQIIKNNLFLVSKIKDMFEYFHLDNENIEMSSYIKDLEDANTYSCSAKLNYRLLVKFCSSKNIRIVAMQYPVRSIKPLQKMLKDFNGIVFVSNEENFKEKLKTTDYRNIFKDLFAGDFGHCTDLGNQMIADNLADTLVKLIN